MSYICPNCKKENDAASNYCSFCGNKNVVNEDITTFKRIKIYLASFFLAPLGLYWFFKYFKSANSEKRKVGYHSLYITIIVLVLSAILIRSLIKEVPKYLELYETNLDVYSELGY